MTILQLPGYFSIISSSSFWFSRSIFLALANLLGRSLPEERKENPLSLNILRTH